MISFKALQEGDEEEEGGERKKTERKASIRILRETSESEEVAVGRQKAHGKP
jgi:hypothetical protein